MTTRPTLSLVLCALIIVPTWALAQDVLPRPEQPFQGHIGRTAQDSSPDFPKEVQAPKGAPNVLLILTDDVGFGASSTFGGPVPTPTMDWLAQAGLRYTQFHTTALCSPTRAALLSGRNHHSAASGANGVIATQSGRFNGWGLYLLDGKPVFHYNLVGVQRFTIAGKEKLAPGKHVILVDFTYDGGGIGKGGTVTLSVDEKPVAEGRIDRTYAFRVSLDETLDIGEDTGTPVSEDYRVPFKFTGTLNRVLIRLSDSPLSAEDEEQIRRARAAITLSQ